MKRRDFFKIVGVTSGAALSGCGQKSTDQKLLPYLVAPEQGAIPGQARYLASTCGECPAGCGLQVKVINGQAVKLEGNPLHPVNAGALCLRGQAALSRLYHPQRMTTPLRRQGNSFRPVSWAGALAEIRASLHTAADKGQQNIYLSSGVTGSLGGLIDEFCRDLGVERLKELELFHPGTINRANDMVFNHPLIPHYRIDQSDFLLTLGADLFETFLSPVQWARQYAQARAREDFRWYHLEPYLSLTGAASHRRLVVKPGKEAVVLAYLLTHTEHRQVIPPGIMALVPDFPAREAAAVSGMQEEALEALRWGLTGARRPLIISGGPTLHHRHGLATAVLTALLQWALGMTGDTVDFSRAVNDRGVGQGRELEDFFSVSCQDGIGTAFFVRLPTFHFMPQLYRSIQNIGLKVAISQTPNRVTEQADLVLPLADPLECWDDKSPRLGLECLVQPVQEPLDSSRGEGDILLSIMGKKESYRDYLAGRWQNRGPDWLERGFLEPEVPPLPVSLDQGAAGRIKEAGLWKNIADPGSSLCLFVVPGIRTFDGRGEDLRLATEIPDPLSTVTYGQWANVSLPLAAEKNLASGDVAAIQTRSGGLFLPVVPGSILEPGLVTVAFYSHFPLPLPVDKRSGEFLFCYEDITVTWTGEPSRLPRLSGSLQAGARGILPGEKAGAHTLHRGQHRLYPPPEHKEYRWAMAIDLDACTGCAACVAACTIENNVPLVGQKEHLKGREMSWLRIEPYFDGGTPGFIPMMCQQCDFAPCETVCPVYATYHNPEGLNAQVYNRCVGTRYCANNCPYKVRRFNWFNNAANQPLFRVSNPELSVRPRGVMEKCSFCFQRIRAAKDRARDEGRLVRDGEINPACSQTCPLGAITFGNLLDPDSRVSRLTAGAGAYRVLEQLGTEPAVFYITGRLQPGSRG